MFNWFMHIRFHIRLTYILNSRQKIRIFFSLCHFCSGLMYSHNISVRRVPEVVARSGSVLLHFFSDDAYNMSGFNISYKINGCPTDNSSVNCSGHGVCNEMDGTCDCDHEYYGFACQTPKCPNNCSRALGRGHCDDGNRYCFITLWCNAFFSTNFYDFRLQCEIFDIILDAFAQLAMPVLIAIKMYPWATGQVSHRTVSHQWEVRHTVQLYGVMHYIL